MAKEALSCLKIYLQNTDAPYFPESAGILLTLRWDYGIIGPDVCSIVSM
jgi:hypothetical protein